ncbi:glutaredoxin [Aspergillus campestris IBT 28561]|uniref:Glutaredoxin n=1 Tax=Aspergillus campestris (strain IBT 28561) TaxID=1392248 RepID=A0A2I1CTI6_ASPC2|nr:glutaredoxin [Aspergillus campestris IBT 28561]PKY00925.1 glutaredoxin [Aspergillus campestris IBT 28561]
MLSQRRMRLLAVVVFTLIVIALYYSRDSHQEQNQKFYKSTVAAIEAQKEAAELEKTAAKQRPAHRKPAEKPPPIDDDTMRPATPKNPDDTEEISIAGRTKITVPKNRDDPVQQGSESPSNPQADDKTQADHKTPQADDTPKTDDAPEGDAKTELNSILKRAPIIIFSKSYCPFSARAKFLLLNRYSIVPAPFVVELDKHPLGPQLQTIVAEKTGRRTVPNVLVNGKSIGGGDDVTALDESDELVTTLKDLGGKWIQEVTRHEAGP